MRRSSVTQGPAAGTLIISPQELSDVTQGFRPDKVNPKGLSYLNFLMISSLILSIDIFLS